MSKFIAINRNVKNMRTRSRIEKSIGIYIFLKEQPEIIREVEDRPLNVGIAIGWQKSKSILEKSIGVWHRTRKTNHESKLRLPHKSCRYSLEVASSYWETRQSKLLTQ
jgi:hypothetical protein